MNRVCERVALTLPPMSVLVACRYALSSAIALPLTLELIRVHEPSTGTLTSSTSASESTSSQVRSTLH